jgi:hypothetical protein
MNRLESRLARLEAPNRAQPPRVVIYQPGDCEHAEAAHPPGAGVVVLLPDNGRGDSISRALLH